MESAIQRYQAALTELPADTGTCIALGKSLLILNDQKGAETVLRAAHERIIANQEASTENVLSVKAWLAAALLRRGEHDESKKLLDEALAANPKHGDANWIMGQWLGQRRALLGEGRLPLNAPDVRAAIESLSLPRLERTAYAHVIVAALSTAEAAARMEADTKLKSELKIEGTIDSQLVEMLLQRLHSRAADALLRAAEKHLDLASVMLADNPAVLCDWGVLELDFSREFDAEMHFRKAIKLEPKGAWYYFWLGRALRKQARFGPAIQAEQMACELNPKLAEPLIELASIYAQVREEREAESAYRAALSVEPTSISAMEGLSRLLVGASDPGQRNYLDAVMLLRTAVELTKGRNLTLIVQQAEALALAKYYEQAGEVQETAIALAHELKVPANLLESLLLKRQEYQYQQNKLDREAEGVVPVASVFEEPVPPDNPYENAPLPKRLIDARVIPPFGPMPRENP